MKGFFMRKSDQHKFELFKLILFSKNGISVNPLSEKSDISLNLIYQKLKALNNDLAEIFSSNKVRLIKNNTFFTILIDESLNINFVIDTLRLHYIQQSHEYLIFHSILTNYFSSVEALSQKINLSVAQTYKSLNAINRALGYFGVKLIFTGEKSHSNFQGLEINIRLFLFYYYWAIFKGIIWPFRESLSYLKEIDVPIDNISESQKVRLNYYQTLSTWRIFYRNKLVTLDSDFLEVAQLMNTIHPIKFSVDMNISEAALIQEESYFGFLCRFYIYNSDTKAQKLDIARAFIQSDLPISKSCTFILDRIYTTYSIEPTYEDYLFSYHSLLVMLTFITYLDIDNTDLFEHNQNLTELGTDFADFPQMEAELSELAKQLFSEAPYLGELKSKGSFTYMVYLFYFIIDYSKKPQQLKIFIQYSKNHITTAEIERSLSSFFSSESIAFVDDINQSDFLISDCYEKGYPNENFFYFDNPLNQNEWASLVSYISTQLYKKVFYKQV
ncbi:hypothetical protein ATZ33_10965 [Enterococcus silesiacus]|uniref:Mga helix-turn-helix domain-containing protein n=1 Tax=Enterococcus silesiacus TaxID=332949 RepID=A0A0S3KCA8_9ENTE|nr:helix-turn-helix domain-containing protein [Enterococcus silesiacus]ALS01880.1 hypothetical protein ATZ33_10965 [Enterococcus silesiacus]OJG92142.1 hypothetical protein RV15_GL003527 [Enterococcus silesiacus]